jgi:hypothetical protein
MQEERKSEEKGKKYEEMHLMHRGTMACIVPR